jgi:AraC-like DNA-binding protein
MTIELPVELRLRSEDFFSGELPIAVLPREPQPLYPPHSHDFHELVMVTAGSGEHATERGSHKLMAGDVFLVRRERVHSYTAIAGLQLINILYDPERLLPVELRESLEPLDIVRSGRPLRLDPANLLEAMAVAEQLRAELSGDRFGRKVAVVAAFHSLMVRLVRFSRASLPAEQGAAGYRIARVIHYLEEHFAEPLDLAQLAKKGGMSVSHLVRSFRQYTGRPPVQYLLDVRIRNASQLLVSSDWNITEIALRCGFSDGNYFTRQFRRRVKLNPTEYRRLHRQMI